MFSLFSQSTQVEQLWQDTTLQSPLTKQDYIDVADKGLNDVLTNICSEGWTVVLEKEGALIEEKKIPGSDLTAIRTSIVLKGITDINKVIKCVHSPTFEERKQVYEKLSGHDLVEVISEEIVVTHSKFSAPMGITGRDFLTVRSKRQLIDGTFVVAVRSINRKDVPYNSNYVRGVSNSDIYIFPISESNDVRIVAFDHIDPKGWMPTYVVNQFKSSAGDWLINMQKVYGQTK